MVVINDQPDYYEIFCDKKIFEVIIIDTDMRNNWIGKSNFFWRIKRKSIELVFLQNPNKDLIYVDSDTLLNGQVGKISYFLKQG